MKKTLFLLAVSLVLLAAKTPTYTFRKTWWGMTPAQVRKSETAKFVKLQKKPDFVMTFKGFINNSLKKYPVYIEYTFENNKLGSAYYYSKKDNLFLIKIVEKLLYKKYGKPCFVRKYIREKLWIASPTTFVLLAEFSDSTFQIIYSKGDTSAFTSVKGL